MINRTHGIGLQNERMLLVMEYIKCDTSKPYVFISYKREDADLVKSDIGVFQHRFGVNIWCDKELEHVGSERWQLEALKAIRKGACKLLLLYASAKALASINVQAEIAEAKRMGVEILIVNFIDEHFDNFLIQSLRDDDDIINNVNDLYNMDQAITYLDDLLVKDRTFYSRKDPAFYDLVLGVIKNKENLRGVIIRNGIESETKVTPAQEPEQKTESEPKKEPHKPPPPPPANKVYYVDTWLKEFIESTPGVNNTKPPGVKGTALSFSTDFIEAEFGFEDFDKPKESEDGKRSVAVYWIQVRPEYIDIGLTVLAHPTDAAESNRRAAKLKELTGLGKGYFEQGRHGTGGKIVFSKKTCSGACGKFTIKKEDFSKMLNMVIECEKERNWLKYK